MKKEEFSHKIFARYMAGECSVQEKREIEEWAQESVDNAQKLEEIRHVWKASKEIDRSREKFDAGEGWKTLNRRLKQEEEAENVGKESSQRFRSVGTSIHSASRQFMRFAAIFLIAGLAGLFAWQNFYQPESAVTKPVVRKISTDKAQQVNLTLSDGTEVMLNAESSITLPAHFKSDIREVSLEGQAYFDVAPDPQKPFVIHSGGSVIRVLGTSFSIRSYPEDRKVLVVVKEGRVSFERDNGKSFQKKVLTKGQLGLYDSETKKIESEKVEDVGLYLGWMEGHLRFDETLMRDVAIRLERRYNLNVTFDDRKIEDMKLTAFLKSRSVKNVLNVITESLQISYNLEGAHVTFFKKDT